MNKRLVPRREVGAGSVSSAEGGTSLKKAGNKLDELFEKLVLLKKNKPLLEASVL